MKVRTALLLLLLLAIPLNGFSQTTLNFPRLYSVADLATSGFAIVNPSATAVTDITFKLYSATGVEIASTATLVPALSVPARGGLTLLGSQLFPNANAAGWVQATSATKGLQGFWLGGNFTTFTDGAEAAPVGNEFIFPLATNTTELNIANLAVATNTLTISIYSAAGQVLATATQNVQPNGIYKSTLPNIPWSSSVNFANAMYVKVTGTGNITGTSVAVDFIYSPSWSVINGINSSSTLTEANFPHVPSGPENGGPKWNGVIGITNLTSVPQTIVATYYRRYLDVSGALVDDSPVEVIRGLSAYGSLRETVKDMFGFNDPLKQEEGWVKVTGSGPIGGYIAYGYSGTAGVAVVPVQAVPQTQMMFSHVANGPGWATGLALLNATSADATAEVYIMRRSGALVGGAQNVLTASINLPAGTKTAKLLSELVPASVFDDGFLYVKSTNNVPLYAFQLFFTRDAQVIANVAAGAIDPSITFTPPAPATAGLTPLPPFTITSITPSTAPRGNAVIIAGTGFSATAANNTVVFTSATGTISATPTAATAVSLTVTVPSVAIAGPVYVIVGNRFSPSTILQVTASATTVVASNVQVGTSQNTIADIYVAPAGTLNASALGMSLTTETTASIGASSVEMPANASRRLYVTGTAVSSSTIVTTSDPTITVSPSGLLPIQDYVTVTIGVPPSAPPGPRNIILTNTSNLETSIITGGLIIR